MNSYEEVIEKFENINLSTLLICHYDTIAGQRVLRFMPKIGKDFEIDETGTLKISMVSYRELVKNFDKLSSQYETLSGDVVNLTLSTEAIMSLSDDISALTLSCLVLKGLSSDLIKLSTDFYPMYNQAIKIQGMSSLDYYTYIGDNIAKISSDQRLSSISSDVIWFDTRDEEKENTPRNIKKIENLQYQVYRLGLQMQEVKKIQDFGAVPGDVPSTIKSDLVQISEKMEIPKDMQTSQTLEDVDVYGDIYMKNGTKYYLVFNPAGFEYNKKNTKIKWYFEKHDADLDRIKTFDAVIGGNYYGLKVELRPYDSDSTTSSIVYYTDMSACQCPATSPKSFTPDQDLINVVIQKLSETDPITAAINVSTDYQYEPSQYITMIDPFDVEIHEGETTSNYSLSILGESYINDYTYYCCKFNDSVKNLPLVADVTWKYVRSDGVLSDAIDFPVYDSTTGEERTDAYVTLSFINKNDMVCFPKITYHGDCKLTDIQNTVVSVFVQSNYDTELSTIRKFNIGGQQPQQNDATLKAVCAKVGKKEDIAAKVDSLYKGELLYFSDTCQLAVYNGDGEFNIVGSGSGGGGITKDQLQNIELDHLTFQCSPLDTAQLKIDSDGNTKVIKKTALGTSEIIDTKDKMNVYVDHLLQIGKIYCGGTKSGYTNCVASHNFVELTNASEKDIDLNGLYLMYRTTNWDTGRSMSEYAPPTYNIVGGDKWEFLELHGVIKAKGTFLIRGQKCNDGLNAVLQINDYDMEWNRKTPTDTDGFSDANTYKRTGDPIVFDQEQSNFYLLIGKSNVQTVVVNGTDKIWSKSNKPSETAGAMSKGYIDLVSVGTNANKDYSEGTTQEASGKMAVNSKSKADDIVYIKYFYMDPSKQGNKVYGSRSTKTLWTYVDFGKYNQKTGNYTERYYSNELKMRCQPHASYQNGAMIFSNKTKFDDSRPNIVNITFGRQATYNGDANKASRCFNWISEGSYDEFVCYRNVTTGSAWTTVYSIDSYTDLNKLFGTQSASAEVKANVEKFHKFYDRVHWTSANGQTVTTHKVILHNALVAGQYEYYVGRDGDSRYKSETMQFTVHANSAVSKFSFIQTTDQQGFNWLEYQAWNSSAQHISNIESNFNFTINTGDIAQSGNRINEWIDYYDGRAPLQHKEEMFTIGNNDLCGKMVQKLGDGNDATSKYNLVNQLYYYTFELDPYNTNNFASYQKTGWATPNEYPLYSLYSFNYGTWHFVSLVSEIRPEYSQAFDEFNGVKDDDFAGTLNQKVEQWFLQDLKNFKGGTLTDESCSKCVVYMHEMPFTILARNSYFVDGTDGTEAKTATRAGGSKLNDYNKNGKFRFSRLFRKYGIRLVFGGHKHTYSISKPVYDAPTLASYLDPTKENLLTSDAFVKTDAFLAAMDESTALDSRKPVIEVLRGTTDSYYTKELSSHARYVVVDKIKAPTYVMSQASGYKVVSNKESPMPLGNDYGCEIPFLLSYFPGKYNKTSNDTHNTDENKAQHRPMYIRYDFEDSAISVVAKQVDNVYKNTAGEVPPNKPSTFDINQRYQGNLSSVVMTFGIDTLGYVEGNYKTHGWYQPKVSDIKSSYESMMHDNTYVITL